MKKQTKDVIDDANDFNDDYSLLDAFSRAESEGNLTEARAKKGSQYGGYADDDEGGYGGYGGKRGKFMFTNILPITLNNFQFL